MTLTPAHRAARIQTAPVLYAGQPVQFRRPSPRGGLGLCRGEVVSVTGSSVAVRRTVSTVISLPVGAQLRLTVWEVSPVPRNPLSAAVPLCRPRRP